MSAAHVIDLESFRQQRREKAQQPVNATPQLQWQPVWVWFWMPVR